MKIPTPDEFAKQGGYNPFPPRWERWLSAVREGILSAQPQAGRHVTTDEHPGKGTVINVDDTSARRPGGGGPPTPTGACCIGTECSITTEAACIGAGGTYQGDDTTCDPNPCVEVCPCQPTHMSLSWQAIDTGDEPAGEPTFNQTFTAEVDIPPLDATCTFGYSDSRLFTEVTGCEDAIINDPTAAFELSLSYDVGLGVWVVSFSIIIGDHSIKCNGWEAWPHPDSAIIFIDGTFGATRTFECPPATIEEDLTGGGPNPNFTGHVIVSFT